MVASQLENFTCGLRIVKVDQKSAARLLKQRPNASFVCMMGKDRRSWLQLAQCHILIARSGDRKTALGQQRLQISAA